MTSRRRDQATSLSIALVLIVLLIWYVSSSAPLLRKVSVSVALIFGIIASIYSAIYSLTPRQVEQISGVWIAMGGFGLILIRPSPVNVGDWIAYFLYLLIVLIGIGLILKRYRKAQLVTGASAIIAFIVSALYFQGSGISDDSLLYLSLGLLLAALAHYFPNITNKFDYS